MKKKLRGIVYLFRLFPDKVNLLKYIRNLESILNKYKINEMNYKKMIDDICKLIEENEIRDKELKIELFRLKKIVRNLPAQRQIYVHKLTNIN